MQNRGIAVGVLIAPFQSARSVRCFLFTEAMCQFNNSNAQILKVLKQKRGKKELQGSACKEQQPSPNGRPKRCRERRRHQKSDDTLLTNPANSRGRVVLMP
jgi:hypothetical protein